jgi:purine-binding chemotaxis protein CheW
MLSPRGRAWDQREATVPFNIDSEARMQQNNPSSHHTPSEPQEYLTFSLGEEEYGMDILRVQEIRGYDAVTKIANAPDFIKGVINLRGVIVPILDMRIKFNLPKITYDQFTVVIVLNIGKRVIGMVVDGVSDVLTLAPEQVRAAPEFSSTLDTQYLTGLGSVDERMIILVDIDQLLMSPEMALMDKIAA